MRRRNEDEEGAGAKRLDQKGCDNGRGNGANGKVEQQSGGELDPFVAGCKVMGMAAAIE